MTTKPFPPYAPSWVNRLTDRVARLPGQSWMYYLALWGVIFGVFTAVQWYEGGYPVGTFNAFHLVITGASVAMLLLMRYMNRAAEQAMQAARPLLTMDDATFNDLLYRLTTLPARATLGVSAVLLLVGLPGLIRPDFFARQAEIAMTPLSIGVTVLNSIWLTFGAGAVIYQLYRQTGVINLILTYARVDLFQLSPLYGFSRVTALPAIALVLLASAFYLVQPHLIDNPSNIATLLFGLVLSAAVFVLPLVGAHNRIMAEKERVLGETAQRIKAAIQTLHQNVDTTNWAGAQEIKDSLIGLDTEQKIIQQIPTWPWQPETPRILFTALFIPLLLFLIQFVVQKFVVP